MTATPAAATQRCALCRGELGGVDEQEPAQPLCSDGIACAACAVLVRRHRHRVAAWARVGAPLPAPGALQEPRRDVYGMC